MLMRIARKRATAGGRSPPAVALGLLVVSELSVQFRLTINLTSVKIVNIARPKVASEEIIENWNNSSMQ